ncbi:MAG: TIGR01777 family protein [Akkermansiaceae bacterium]|nr:TIGR01777 family protein [Akkermansiaceae bacterium]NNM31401.1 TIGR01777 family protein [Akkermansiaceae bacterium]
MKIVIAGANGFLGRAAGRHLLEAGHEVVGLVRHAGGVAPGVREVAWDGATAGAWASELEDAGALINLAGRSVNCRYSARHRAEILASRVDSTRILGDAIALCRRGPELWINASTATVYRHAEDRPQGEYGGDIGEGFSVQVALAWEKAFFGARVPGKVRKVALRTSLVLGREKGTVFDYFWKIARYGLGGKMGGGRQMVSWIHAEDFCRLLEWVLRREDVEGILNVAAPGAVPNREFMATMRAAAGRRVGLPAARWMLEIGAWALRSESELLLKSRWVAPVRLENEGFRFRWPALPAAIADLAPAPKAAVAASPEKRPADRMKTLSRHVS